MKTVSCKISDKLYGIIDSLPGSHSNILRKALKIYLGSIDISKINKGIPVVYQKGDAGKYAKGL